jgi:hypothetical protein
VDEEGELKVRLDTLTKIKKALEKVGEFIPENGGGAGVPTREAGQAIEIG